MSLNPTLTISIDRTSLSLAALVLSAANDANQLSLASYEEPAIQQRIKWAPESDLMHGSTALAASYQQTMLNFEVGTDLAATEAAARTLLAELRAALGQFSYTITVTVDGATAEVWTCQPGSIGATVRTYENLRSHNAVYPVSVPCYPVRS